MAGHQRHGKQRLFVVCVVLHRMLALVVVLLFLLRRVGLRYCSGAAAAVGAGSSLVPVYRYSSQSKAADMAGYQSEWHANDADASSNLLNPPSRGYGTNPQHAEQAEQQQQQAGGQRHSAANRWCSWPNVAQLTVACCLVMLVLVVALRHVHVTSTVPQASQSPLVLALRSLLLLQRCRGEAQLR